MSSTILARDRFNDTIQCLQLGTVVQNVSFTGAGSTQSAAFGAATIVIRVVATVNCYISTGADPTASAATTLVGAYTPEYFKVAQASSWKIAAFGLAGSGVLNVTEMR